MERFLVLLALLAQSAAGQPAAGQPGPDVLMVSLGETTKRLTAASDTTQHYALYLPSAYDAERPGPVLFLMDPRGRALRPLNLFRAAAERFGYVVMSSYETLSDSDSAYAVNSRALDALVQDAQLRFAIDPARLYIGGFSGTAHFIWSVAPALDGHLAGFVGVGDGLPPDVSSVQATMRMQRPPAYFGIAGDGDFNYDNAWRRHRDLDASALPHRFAAFEGRHAWPPEPLADQALTWLELHAVRAGLAEQPGTWVDSLHAVRVAEAEALERDGRLADALERYREIQRDFDGLVPTGRVRDRMAELDTDPTVREMQRRRNALALRVDEYKALVRAFLEEYRASDLLVPHHRALRRLAIPRLLREAKSEDPGESAAARRMLGSAFAWLGFYEPRDYLETEDFARAAGMLRLAQEIEPAGFLCYRLARAEAQLGKTEEALDALACAVAERGVSPESLHTDPLLAPLRHTDRYAEIVGAYPLPEAAED